jgi:hypothetical protein
MQDLPLISLRDVSDLLILLPLVIKLLPATYSFKILFSIIPLLWMN